MSRVVVAGGAGFLGTHLCHALVGRGDEVVSIDNLCTGSEANLAGLLGRRTFSFLRQDIVEPFEVAGPVDVVMNLASPASPKDFVAMPVDILQVGSGGTKRLLDLARRKGARFFQASTSEVYGEPAVHPQPETYWGNVNPIGPRGVYDEAKRFGEALTMAYHRSFGVDVRIARIFNTYGPYMRPGDGRVVSNFIWQALQGKPMMIYGDGSQTRSFTFATDEVAGLLALLDSDYVGPVNIGNPSECTVVELAHLILDATGSSSELISGPLPQDDPTKRQPDITLARTVLGWEPEVTLAEGIRTTIDWFAGLLGPTR